MNIDFDLVSDRLALLLGCYAYIIVGVYLVLVCVFVGQ